MTGFKKALSIVEAGVLTLGEALTGGLTILIAFAPEIIKWVGEMMKGTTTLSALNKTLKDNKIVMDAVNQAKLQGSQNAQREITDLNALYKATQDHNLSLRQKKAAVSALKDQWPDTFKNVSDETIMAGKAATAYKNLKDQILAASYAEAAKNKITANASRALENEDKITKERIKNLQILKEQKDLQNSYKKHTDYEQKHPYNDEGSSDSGYAIALDQMKQRRDASDKIIYDLTTDTNLLNTQSDKFYQEIEKRVKLFGVSITTGSKNAANSYNKQPQLKNNNQRGNVEDLQAMSIDFAQTIELEKKNYDTEQAALDDKLKNKLISQEDYQKQSQQLQDQYHQNIGTKVKEFNEVDFESAKKNLQSLVDQNEEEQAKITESAKKHTQERKDFELQATQQISNAAFSILQNSIKSQSDAKIKQLETQKQSELNNSSLTASQK